jgi:hypothetical protein
MSSRSLQEEQERELAPEIEQERQLERPKPAEPAPHSVHPDVLVYVKEGRIKRTGGNDGFMWAFDIFNDTTPSEHFRVDNLPRALLVTWDFARTIERSKVTGVRMDSYLRAVQWVLTGRGPAREISTMVIISPHEVNKLIPEIETSKCVSHHLFSPRVNQTLQPLDHMGLYTIPRAIDQAIPRRLIIELILFSGQTYFSSFEQYVEVCGYLCLAHEATDGDMVVRPDSFIDPASHGTQRDPYTIVKQSPVNFLKGVMTIRRSGETIEKTHLGRLLNGSLLDEDDFCEE